MMRPVRGIRIPSATASQTSSTSGIPKRWNHCIVVLSPSPSRVVIKLPTSAHAAIIIVTPNLLADLPALMRLSRIAEIPPSIMPIEEERQAKNTSSQNRNAKIHPPFMSLNTVGMDTKSSPGPAPKSIPNAEQAGMIARPASRAAHVSPTATMTASFSRFSFLSRYEP